jgi:serine/threonine-protein kinase
MASVWVARQRGKHGFEKLVAIKTILPKFAADLRFQEMFLDEARIAARIEHTNVAQIFDLGEENEILYLVMEYVDGDAISKLNRVCLKKGVKIPLGVVLRILADACAGLHEAHELRDASGKPLEIVHRDVSPHNILVSTRGIAKLIDFGIAKTRSRAGGDTNSGVLKGKIQYMAPEQAAANPVDRRADLWAVGAILYHLVAGKPPYEGDNQLATLHLLGSGRPPMPLPPTVPLPISAIVRRALTHAPEKRYATAAELRGAIEQAMIDARMQTTTADVAQFWAQHMSERADRRKQAIDFAIASVADRKRVEQLLRPQGERAGSLSPASGTPSPFSFSASPRRTPNGSFEPPPATSAFPVAPSAANARALVRLTPRLSDAPQVSETQRALEQAQALSSEPLVAAEPPRFAEPASQVSSYATLGSAAVDTSPPLRPAGRRSVFPVVAGTVLAAVAVTAFSFAVFRPSAEPTSAASAAPPSPPPPRADTTPVETATSAALAAPPASGAGEAGVAAATTIPTIGATALPKASPPAREPARPRYVPPPAPPRPKPAKTIDDGF